MSEISNKPHRFPPDFIRQAVWLYFRFTLTLRDIEELPAKRGVETVRCWILMFGRLFAYSLRRSAPKPTARWHLDEMVVNMNGQGMWLRRTVDDEGAVRDRVVQKRRNTAAPA